MTDENSAGEHAADLRTGTEVEDAAGQWLDPFEFHGHPASSIAGLGGSVALPDGSYAFHTSYVPVARGHAHFHVRFDNLQARRGSLILRVHMLPNEPGAVALMVTSHRVQLSWLAHHGGQIQLRFEAFRGARYAIMGVTPDQLDARADGLAITLDRPATAEDLADASDGTEARSTAFASDSIRAAPVPLLVSMEAPSFAQPVSQPYTSSQTRDRAFRDRCAVLPDLPTDPGGRWEIAYPLQVLDRYGALRATARGLTIGRERHPLAAALAMAGTIAERVTLAGSGDTADDGTGVQTIPAADLPGDLFAFDFLLSVREMDAISDTREAARFLERSMECLRPGGVAVHVVAHHPDPSRWDQLAFDRNGLERLAFALISSGHQLARLKPPPVMERRDDPIPFGLIARRGAAIR